MDWLVLLAIVPALLVPAVLLLGFPGCGLSSAGVPGCIDDGDCPSGSHCATSGLCIQESEMPPKPQNLAAVAISDHAVFLTWDADPSATGFLIERAEEDGPFDQVSASPDPAGTTDDKDLVEGKTFVYQVTAFIGQAASLPSMSSATVFPLTPTDLVATPVGPDEIDLAWTNASAVASEFRVEDTTSTPPRVVYEGSPTNCKDMGLSEGSQHDYQVFATVVNGFQSSVQQPVDSTPALVSATTFSSFTPAFTAPAGPSTDQPGVEGFCIVQRISASLLTGGGTTVRVVLRGSTTGSLTLDRVTISRVAPGATSDPYDSAVDLATVTGAVTLAANTPQTLGPIGYVLDPTQDLLVAFDVSATPGQGNMRFGPLPGADSWARAVTSEAAVQDRSAGYTQAANNLYLIEAIEVA